MAALASEQITLRIAARAREFETNWRLKMPGKRVARKKAPTGIGRKRMVDKLLVGNDTALSAKYGNVGLQAIQAAVSKLIAADQGRGLQTIYVAVDSQATMQGRKRSAVPNRGDPAQ